MKIKSIFIFGTFDFYLSIIYPVTIAIIVTNDKRKTQYNSNLYNIGFDFSFRKYIQYNQITIL